MSDPMRYNHPLQTEVDSLRRELAGEQRQLQVVTAERDAAEDRFVKARAENSEQEDEISRLTKEIDIRRDMHARLQEEYDMAKPFMRLPAEEAANHGAPWRISRKALLWAVIVLWSAAVVIAWFWMKMA